MKKNETKNIHEVDKTARRAALKQIRADLLALCGGGDDGPPPVGWVVGPTIGWVVGPSK